MLATFGIISGLLVIFFVFCRKRLLTLDPYTIFFLSSFVYMFYVPLGMRVLNDYTLPSVELDVSLNVVEWAHVVLLAFIALIASSVAFQTVSSILIWPFIKIEVEKHQARVGALDADTKFLIGTSVLITGLLIALFWRQLLAETAGYVDAYSIVYENSLFAFHLYLSFMATFVLICHLVLTRKRYLVVFATAACLFVVAAVTLYSKRYLLLIIIIGFCVLYRVGLRRRVTFLLLAFGSMTIALTFVFPIYAIYRGGGGIDLSYLSSASPDIFFSDAPGPFGAIAYIMQSRAWHALSQSVDTSPLWLGFFLWIPRAFWATRPLDPSEAFARFVVPDWRPGVGVGFSPLAEGLLRFGDLGALIVPAVLGLTCALLLALFLRMYPRSLWPALFIAIGGSVLFYAERGPFSQIVGLILQFFLPHVIVFHTARFIGFVWRRNVRPYFCESPDENLAG